MTVSAPLAELSTHRLGTVDQVLRGVCILAAISVPLSSFVAEFVIGGGGILHLVLAIVAATAGGLFFLRTRGRPSSGKLLVAFASIGSLAWIVGVTSLALLYGWLMSDFH